MADVAVFSDGWLAAARDRAAGAPFPPGDLRVEYQCVAPSGVLTHYQVFGGGALREWARGPADEPDLVLRQPVGPHVGILARAFGHSGFGGMTGAFADPDHDVVVAFHLNGRVDDESALEVRRPALVDGIYRAVVG